MRAKEFRRTESCSAAGGKQIHIFDPIAPQGGNASATGLSDELSPVSGSSNSTSANFVLSPSSFLISNKMLVNVLSRRADSSLPIVHVNVLFAIATGPPFPRWVGVPTGLP